jgi:hypothetical protein
MPFTTFAETRPWAKAIRDAVRTHKMPPWFADPCCGKFANNRALSVDEIETLAAWADAGAPAGDPHDAPPPRPWPTHGNLDAPDLTLAMPHAFNVPASGSVEYQYSFVPTGFNEDRWIQACEVRPGARAVIHHVVVYIRERGETWTHGPTKADILSVWAPGSAPDSWPAGMAKLIPAKSDLVFEIHYTPNGKPASDRTSIELKFAAAAPPRRVLTLQMSNERFLIPAGERDYRIAVSGTLPNDALLLGFFPHMHLRGRSFEYTRIGGGGQSETLLRVPRYDFYWQLTYKLAEPIPLAKGTRLQCVARYDNSDNAEDVRYGQQSWEEMMIGFFDVAVDASVDKKQFFVREK